MATVRTVHPWELTLSPCLFPVRPPHLPGQTDMKCEQHGSGNRSISKRTPPPLTSGFPISASSLEALSFPTQNPLAGVPPSALSTRERAACQVTPEGGLQGQEEGRTGSRAGRMHRQGPPAPPAAGGGAGSLWRPQKQTALQHLDLGLRLCRTEGGNSLVLHDTPFVVPGHSSPSNGSWR